MTDVEHRSPPESADVAAPDMSDEQLAELEEAGVPLPVPFPLLTSVSGRYSWTLRFPFPWPPPTPGPQLPTGAQTNGAQSNGDGAGHPAGALPLMPLLFRREDLRLDVDRRYPQMTASGTSSAALTERYHWIANLTEVGPDHWTGPIWYRDGNVSLFPYTNVDITAKRSLFPTQRHATVTFSGGGQPTFARTYAWASSYYHSVDFEYDSTSDSHPVMSIETCDHPNRPSSLPCESLSIDKVYRRAGFDVSLSPSGSVPLSGAGTDARWSDSEMHDAMQTYWSHFADAPQWALWTFWAALHEQGTSLGGIMFDDIGPNHRQGTALFTEAFIKNAPAGDAAPDAWVKRMRFWTAVHEMGHAFNLAHSWQKSLGTPWVPLLDEPEARSFMNYPYRVSGGESAFFADFDFGFTDAELLFMRHAPMRFVQMGNADWFDHHGFQQDDADRSTTASSLELVIRANRERADFEFLEPVVLEAKLTNRGTQPVLLPSTALAPQGMVAIIKRRGMPARQWHPYARYCRSSDANVLPPGESCYESVPIYAGLNGWDVSEPGVYEITLGVEIDGAMVTSKPLLLRVRPPRDRDEEDLAQGFFSEDVGRTLAFGGTAVLDDANEALRETVDRLPESRAARHATAALAGPLASEHKLLEIPDTGRRMATVAATGGSVVEKEANPEEAAELLGALSDVDAAETLGHIGYRRRIETATAALARGGATEPAATLQRSLLDVLSEREVLPSVLDEVSERVVGYESAVADEAKSAD